MTFTAGTTLTAAQLNTHLRDNLLETATAKAATEGSYFVATGVGAITARTPKTAFVSTSQSTSSTSYVDLATSGPAVTVTTGNNAIVITSCSMDNNTANIDSRMSWAISGTTTRAASDSTSVRRDGMPATNTVRFSKVYFLDSSELDAGSNTFTAKYCVGDAGSSGTFADRRITVFPF